MLVGERQAVYIREQVVGKPEYGRFIAERKALARRRGIAHEKYHAHALVNARNFGKGLVIDAVGDVQPVRYLDAGKPERGIDERFFRNGGKYAALQLRIARRHEHDKHIVIPEDLLALAFRRHGVGRARSVYRVGAVTVRKPLRQRRADGEQRDEHGNEHVPRLYNALAPKPQLGHEVPMPGPVHRLRQQQQYARHKQEHRQQRTYYAFCEHRAEVEPQPKLHEHERDKPRYRGERARRDLGYSLCERGGHRAIRIALPLVLFLGKAMTEDYSVVYRERELKYYTDRVRYERYFPEPVVGAHIERGGYNEYYRESEYLRKAL